MDAPPPRRGEDATAGRREEGKTSRSALPSRWPLHRGGGGGSAAASMQVCHRRGKGKGGEERGRGNVEGGWRGAFHLRENSVRSRTLLCRP